MHITQSILEQRSSHAAQSQREVSESLRAWVGDRRPDFEGQSAPTNQTGAAGAINSGNGASGVPDALRPLVELSQAALAAQQNDSANAANQNPVGQAVAASDPNGDNGLDPRMKLLKAVIEMLTGQTIQLFNARDISAPAATDVSAPPDPNGNAQAGNAAAQRAGFGVEYDYKETVRESETTTFAANGVVRTADGREINFQASLTMSRQFEATYSERLRLGDAKMRDPLVLNFNGNAAQLSDLKVAFDLNGDGQKESLPFVASGSAFLAFDRNGDGQVNDGRELFGPTSGNGFAELAALDADGNGWIDEADPAFPHLGTWTLGANGPVFKSLADQGIGALSTTGQATPFDLKDSANRLQAQIRATGVFLHESGAAGTIQQIDVAA
ncbi:hypothetical protein OTERR_10760 [Oryzomicrobium terrae]|uniref:VCBS repeat-containing protein n=1 Tax=Oryzomicrobium terrae TaxID=1735038 RepID=A0A5C1E6K0_9RHOO|nr:VCBS repeat-containing protein [Oryzomicrobium terrae]QEL64552.1 hypothetical protein OTERR_10760 [Oryzomicrobium terrae]